MLKWTVSRSLSTTGSTPHATSAAMDKSTRKPFRDLSNTPPTGSSRSTTTQGDDGTENSASRLAGRRRRCRSHGSDLRAYFNATKPNLRSSKRQSIADDVQDTLRTETFYQSTPRVDTDIGPVTYIPESVSKNQNISTLPTDPSIIHVAYGKSFTNNNELPQNVINEARVNLQSHVSDFFQQISLAGSPEDVMEANKVPFMTKSRLFSRNPESSCHPKLAKITKLHTRNKTPYHTKGQGRSIFQLRETPLSGKLAHLKINQDISNYENMDNTVTEVLASQQENHPKTVVEILLRDSEERRKILGLFEDQMSRTSPEHIYESILERSKDAEEKAPHNDSSVSSASQLLEDPSPMSWAFRSPSNDSDGEFKLQRQGGIRRKRKDQGNDKSSASKRPKRQESISPSKRKILEQQEPTQAVNLHVKRPALETDLDSTFSERTVCKTSFSQSKEDETEKSMWELESTKSMLIDDFPSSKSSFLQSVMGTPEAPLIATVRRCLKYSPDVDMVRGHSKGSIEIEYSVIGDYIHVRVIRCRDLRRAYEGPIHAYVKASLKNQSGEGVVKRTAVHRATPHPVFHETLILPYPRDNNCPARPTSLVIAVWNRDRRARRSELLGCMTLPLPLAQDKEATWHPLEVGSGRSASTPYTSVPQECAVSPPLSKDGDHADNNNTNADDLTYLRHLELESIDPATGLPLHPGFAAKGGRTPCTITRRLVRQSAPHQVPWGFSLSWGRPPRVERVDPGSPAERAGLRPGDHVVFVDTSNVVIRPREEILSLIQSATTQLILEVYRRTGNHTNTHRPSITNISLQPNMDHPNGHHVTFTAEVGTGVLV